MSIWKWNHAGIFVGGMLFATKGIELLKTKQAHKLLVDVTSLGLKARDEVMKSVAVVKEEAEDIVAEAVIRNKISEITAAAPEVIEDKSEKSDKSEKAAKTTKTTKKTKTTASKAKKND